jgi:hypothetical protein
MTDPREGCGPECLAGAHVVWTLIGVRPFAGERCFVLLSCGYVPGLLCPCRLIAALPLTTY